MPRIVKSFAVVEDREQRPQAAASDMLPPMATVIKREAFSGLPGQLVRRSDPMRKETYLDELNRIRVEVEQAKSELRKVRGQIDRATESGEPEPNRPASGEGAKELIKDAKAQAEEIVAKAKAEAEQIAQSAQNDGYLAGFSQGYDEAAAQFKTDNQPAVEQLGELIEMLSGYREQMAKEFEADIPRVAAAMAEKILNQELEHNPEALLSILYEVLDINKREEYIKVTISKELLPAQAKASDEIRAKLEEAGANVSVVVDKEADPGTIIVETPKGLTDLSVETQLENLQEALIAR